jgi:3-hydroxyisobutyrate dehydrogenase-like beta-hydroxyacid dehydrogenase
MNAIAQSARAWRVGLIGYGEVGRIVAQDLRELGVQQVLAHDRKLGTEQQQPLLEHARDCGVRLAASARELAAGCDLLISAVTASQAVAVARDCAGGLQAGVWFVDLNSASPGAKREAAAVVDAAGGRYVEAAVMTSVPPYRSKVPMLLGGAHARELEPALRELGFAGARFGDERLGIVSATKMCRSVMIKGLEAMVIESFSAARAYGVEDAVLASLAETFPGIDWEKQGAYFFQRVIEHGRRRSEEMREVARTVEEIGLRPWSASGSAERQAWVADLADRGVFGARGEAGFARSPDWRTEADRLLGAATDIENKD